MFAQTTLEPTKLKLLNALDVGENVLSQLEVKIASLVNGSGANSINFPQSDAQLAAIYHLSSGGRRVRGRLAVQASLALGLSKDDALCIAAVAELLHNASLVHDDLQDKDTSRHGLPTVWAKFGSNVAICTGDLMLSAAYAALCGTSRTHVIPSLLALVHERTALAIQGQCADLAARSQSVNRTNTYEKIVIAKSGALLSLPLELALLASGKHSGAGQARSAAEAFSLAYQVADDLADQQRDAQVNSLNIGHVLQAAGDNTDAVACAYQYGARHIDIAIAAAQQLPSGAGALLLQLSYELREFFNAKE